MEHVVKVEQQSYITLPDEIVESFGIKEGDEITIREHEDGVLELIPKKYTNVEIDLPEEVLFQLMKMAHEQDVTLNQLVNDILRKEMNRLASPKERRISINALAEDEFDRVIKDVDDGQTVIICEDDECEKPVAVMVPMDRYNEMKNME